MSEQGARELLEAEIDHMTDDDMFSSAGVSESVALRAITAAKEAK